MIPSVCLPPAAATVRLGLLVMLGFQMAAEPATADAWEFLGPGTGYRPESICVTERALYVGMANESWSGVGLYRYRFETGLWDLFLCPGCRVTGVAVWGESDEKILYIAYDDAIDRSTIWRSLDGGETSEVVHTAWSMLSALTQAPSDPNRFLTTWGLHSWDGGSTWSFGHHGYFIDWMMDAAFDPADAQVGYLTARHSTGGLSVLKTTDGGVEWESTGGWGERIAANRGEPAHLLCVTWDPYLSISASTDAGQNWSYPAPPGRTLATCAPVWAPRCFFVAGTDFAQTQHQVWRTWDLGQTWEPCGEGLPGPVWYANAQLAAHPTEPVLFAAFNGPGVWRWTLSGESVPGEPAENRPPLLAIAPNPVTDATEIRLSLPRPGHVVVQLFDLRGRLVDRLCESDMLPGEHRLVPGWTTKGTRSPSPGVYWLRMTAGEMQVDRKVVIVR